MPTGQISYSEEAMALVRGIYLGQRIGLDVVLPVDLDRNAGCSRQVVSAILNREVAEWTPAHSYAAAAEGIRRAQRVRWQQGQVASDPREQVIQEPAAVAGAGAAM